MADVPQDDETIPQSLLLKLHSGLEVVKSQQTSINQRIGRIDKVLDRGLVLKDDLKDLEERIEVLESENRKRGTKWRDWLGQAVFWALGISLVGVIGKYLGVEVAW